MCISSELQRKYRVTVRRPIEAFRVFVRQRDGQLHPCFYPWKTKDYRQGRWHTTKDRPWNNLDYGFHAFKHEYMAREYVETVTAGHRKEVWQVQLAGNIAEHITGYRAMKMKPVRRIYRPRGAALRYAKEGRN